MSDWTSEYLQLIEDCESRSERLDDWTLKFIDSLKSQIADGRRPTPKQVDALDRAWEHATAKG